MTGRSAVERAAEWLAPLGAAGPAGLALGLAVGTLISEDLSCVAAGLLVAHGRLSFALATLACLVGIFAGDLLLVLAGRWLGRPALARPPLAWFVSPATVERSTRWFARRGPAVVMFSRFVPGSRLPLFLAAGILHADFLHIALALLLAGGVWTPMLVGLSAVTGGAVLAHIESFEHWALPVAMAAGLAVLVVARVLVPALTWRGRRLLLSRWRRLTRWEFWPLAVFQTPVVLHWLWLALRYRSLTLFTAANPGIPCGGFVLESKSGILGALGAPGAVPDWRLLDLPTDPAARIAAARRAAAELGGSWPLVGKPDVGERGEGVTVLRDPDALDAWARSAPAAAILQRYAPGEEFGVFYVRRPSEPAGRIFSITAKRFPFVTGDGHRTLEQLILADERAVCQAPLHLERHADALDRVPAAGERVELVEVGNHCRGTTFLDGRDLETPALAARIDELARSFPGFWFGRFDLRAPSVEAFRAGRDLAVLEINGVTSEATHVYAPGASLWAAWRTLAEQWRLAYEIGAENFARGARPARLPELLDLLARRRHHGSARIRAPKETDSR
jgi:membrane protein DedA with SNARE-associated domain